MALTEIDLAKIKVDFESGKLSKSKVAQKHSISRNTLDKYSKSLGWIYATNEQELSKKIELLNFEILLNDEVDRATKKTNNFLGDIESYRRLAMIPASELAKAYNEAEKESTEEKTVKVSKDEFSRIWESTKVIKTAIEGLKIGYDGARKALGMDKDEDIRKAKALKEGEHEAPTDPLAGKTIEEIEAEIKKLDD
jgi:hypothetical protein